MNNNLKNVRNEKFFSQRELSEKSGVPLRSIQHYELGDRKLEGAGMETLLKLADALETPFYSLLDDELKEKILQNLTFAER